MPPPARVVELGSAPGDQIARLADLGHDAVSVDIVTTADAWGSGETGRMARLLEEHGVTAVTWDLEQVPYPLDSEAYDAVVMTEVYEHLRDYPMRSLEECRRVLKPGGYLLLTTPNAAYLLNRLGAARPEHRDAACRTGSAASRTHGTRVSTPSPRCASCSSMRA
ncbi:MAG: class I SAM-dependent methyltransferase [Frankiaceae bacterium]|nr:class I SAM-dependent methyltransferase [Frankiaceae bacterium]